MEGQVRRGQGPDRRSHGSRRSGPSSSRRISAFFPDPVRDYKLDPDDPSVQDELEKLRVHIDAIKPVWRTDLKTEWFDMLDPEVQDAHASL